MARKNPVFVSIWMRRIHFRIQVINGAAFPVSAIRIGRILMVLFIFGLSGFVSTRNIALAQCPSAPTGNASQSFCSAATPSVADLVAIGTAIQWYSVSSGGTALPSSTLLGNGNHYFATQTENGCESSTRFEVTVTINTTPFAPSGASPQVFCSGTSPTLNNLNVTGTAVQWYASAAGGTPLPLSTSLVNGIHYYASQTVSGCESTSRLDITATVNITPAAPTGSPSQTFCGTPRVSALTATGSSIRWYSVPTGGSPLVSTTLLVNGNHYYASQTITGCESSSRFDVTVSINSTPPVPTGISPQTFCTGSLTTVADLVATGTAIQWYLFSIGGSPLPTTTVLGNGIHYYASQTINGCESATRLDVIATVNSTPVAPIGASTQSFCSDALPTVNDLIAIGVGIKWYSAATGGTALARINTDSQAEHTILLPRHRADVKAPADSKSPQS